MARPRALRVKELAASFVPHLAEALGAAVSTRTLQANTADHNLDPRQAGAASWRIEQGLVDAAGLIHLSHDGGFSSLRPVSPSEFGTRSHVRVRIAPDRARRAVGAIAKVIGNAKGSDLSLGDLAGAVAAIDRVYDEIS